jgi:hypothetical protein
MKLESLKQQRETEILSNNKESARPALLQIVTNIDQLHRYKSELNEALMEGHKSSSLTQEVVNCLNEAIRHGEWDMATNNGFHDHNKHRALDKAANAAYRTQQSLQIFNRELYDVGLGDDSLFLDVDSFSKFTDYFLDNLITDWIMQRKIKSSLVISKALLEKIDYILLSKLQNELNACDVKLKELHSLKDSIVINNSI